MAINFLKHTEKPAPAHKSIWTIFVTIHRKTWIQSCQWNVSFPEYSATCGLLTMPALILCCASWAKRQAEFCINTSANPVEFQFLIEALKISMFSLCIGDIYISFFIYTEWYLLLLANQLPFFFFKLAHRNFRNFTTSVACVCVKICLGSSNLKRGLNSDLLNRHCEIISLIFYMQWRITIFQFFFKKGTKCRLFLWSTTFCLGAYQYMTCFATELSPWDLASS